MILDKLSLICHEIRQVEMSYNSWDHRNRARPEIETEGGNLGGLNIEVLSKS